MNQINPKKLLNSKWTAVIPNNKEKHFLISQINFDEQDKVDQCYIEAVMSKREILIEWTDLTDSQLWLQGWK
jgi:tryptophan-rich hypothetical protein